MPKLISLQIGLARRVQINGRSFYLAVDEAGQLGAGETFEFQAGPRQLALPDMFRAKMFKHLR